MFALGAQVVLGALAGPVLLAALAKLAMNARTLVWPFRSGPLAAPHGPRVAGAAELAGAVAMVALPHRWAASVGVLTYGVLAVFAIRMRGRTCPCFGTIRLAVVGRTHAALNPMAAGLCLLAAFPRDVTALPQLRVGSALAALALLFAVVRVVDARAGRRFAEQLACHEPIQTVTVYGPVGDPRFASLGTELLGTEDQSIRDRVTVVYVERQHLPGELRGQGGRFPYALGHARDGGRTCLPVAGLVGVKLLINNLAADTGVRA